MFDLERTKKVIIAMFCLSALSLVLSFIGFAKGGEEVLRYGIMNEPVPSILMFVFAGLFIISLLTGLGFRVLSKDIPEVLKYFTSRK